MVDDRGKGRSCGKSNGSEDVHDEVQPNELCRSEGWLCQGDGSQDESGHSSKVASDLELEEFLNVGENVSAPHDSSENGFKLIIAKDECSSISGD